MCGLYIGRDVPEWGEYKMRRNWDIYTRQEWLGGGVYLQDCNGAILGGDSDMLTHVGRWWGFYLKGRGMCKKGWIA